ncbi:MAG: hypothetical protein Q7V12_02385, partial [Deltaproteobacteria bacterium]|nr:hypothetical protein [Deltaproteobacteria bacterium]
FSTNPFSFTGRYPSPSLTPEFIKALGMISLSVEQFVLRPLCLRVGEFTWCGDLGNSGKRYFLKE